MYRIVRKMAELSVDDMLDLVFQCWLPPPHDGQSKTVSAAREGEKRIEYRTDTRRAHQGVHVEVAVDLDSLRHGDVVGRRRHLSRRAHCRQHLEFDIEKNLILTKS